MSKLSFAVIENNEETSVFGLRKKSNDRTQAKDIPGEVVAVGDNIKV